MKALVVCSDNTVTAGWIPRLLAEGGFTVSVLSRPKSHATRSRFTARSFYLPPVKAGDEPAVMALAFAIRRARPDILVPGDAGAIRFLRRTGDLRASRFLGAQWDDLLQRSIGDIDTIARVDSKRSMLDCARSLGVDCPQDLLGLDKTAALARAEELGLPVVVKADVSNGGWAVRICRDLESLTTGIDALLGISRWISGGAEGTPLLVQEYIAGVPAMRCVAAHNGVVVAGVSAVAEVTDPPDVGASTVLRTVENLAMADAVQRIVAALGLSGLIDFDFVLDEATGRAALLECNPRPVNVAVGARLVGPHLGLALHRALSGEHYESVETAGKIIALFPQELRRNSSSPYLVTARHEVPTDDPALYRSLLEGSTRKSPGQ